LFGAAAEEAEETLSPKRSEVNVRALRLSSVSTLRFSVLTDIFSFLSLDDDPRFARDLGDVAQDVQDAAELPSRF
jgi:hypothetical protein